MHCRMLLNFRGYSLLLQIRKKRISFCYSESHGCRGGFLCLLDGPQLVFDESAQSRLK